MSRDNSIEFCNQKIKGSFLINGYIGLSGSFNILSNISEKDDIKQLKDSLENIKKLTGFSYIDKKSIYVDDKKNGLVAEQIEEAGLEYLIDKNSLGKCIDYISIIPILIEAIKELSSKVDILEEKLRKV